MKKERIKGRFPVGSVIAAATLLCALFGVLYVDHRSGQHPNSDSAVIYTESVHVAALVGGRLQTLSVRENQVVHKGDLLYQIDPEPYEIALHKAEASETQAQADLNDARRALAVRMANAATNERKRHQAEDEKDLAWRTVTRLKPLAEQHYVSWQVYDQAVTKFNSAVDALAEAQHEQQASQVAVGDVKHAEAMLQEASVAVEHARYELRQTRVTANIDGYVTSLNVREGEVLAANENLFTLVSKDEWYAIAPIREINLKPVRPGDCATVYSMIDRSHAIHGVVESIGRGVTTDYMRESERGVPSVERQMDWVHIAQRFPVRIRIEHAPEHLMRLGATANVEILHGAACHG
ncbi:multidrug transporter subunit MdtN [Parasaccharibacter sp. TMW2.1882]|uniref:Multidrug transporter subunit MdtN n=1 Tax=Parasaccharibacter apium TaxID=1510841 RepID=A0ABX4ZM21_9PROT|nr:MULTISPECIES: multidrug transporter subunit MdtN [Acetobacteraceae]MCK8636436.1 multidrug transporter subunit MdtN [Parasaccharibacter sp. TMW2.1885]MCL1496525.1 multidrug transporter subunit MdtN [Parasaccharibacter sp. TMW2.1882]MCL1513047.1 multidrug transporter subunit MdtN [Parasaccharibacter sp. TMW 2.1891]MCL1514622.1 multidrug transporter subunit MdtN [Parasaccharibacter sp. TMW2.1890]MCT6813619.1 multidrug transporter subunit MdtN [Bombella apis]